MIGKNTPNRIFGLDVMRSFAIVMVIVGHCTWIFPPGHGIGLRLLAFMGYIGVETFFVLSGFLIGTILFRMFTEGTFNSSAVKHFLKRRWFRTLPNYFLILLVNIAIAIIIGYSITDVWRYFVFLQNFATPMHPFFPESWSLSVEEFAYLLIPLALLAIVALFKIANRSLLFISTTVLLIVISIVAKIIYNSQTSNTTLEQWNIGLKMVVIYRLDAILWGVFCSWLYVRFPKIWKIYRIPVAVIGCFLVAFLLFGIGKLQLLIEYYPFLWNVIYLPLTSITLALFLPILSEWKTHRSILTKSVTIISMISYSIYLIHYGVVLQLMKHFLDLGHGSPEQLTGFVIIYLFLTLSLSWLLYRYYEKPMTDLRNRL